MARAVLPHPAILVPFLAVGAHTLEPERAGLLVEVTARERAAGRSDGLKLVAGALDHGRVEAEPLHHALGAALKPQALAGPLMRKVVVPKGKL